MPKKKKYYAIHYIGGESIIVNTWSECQQKIKGRANLFKSFETKKEAESYLKNITPIAEQKKVKQYERAMAKKGKSKVIEISKSAGQAQDLENCETIKVPIEPVPDISKCKTIKELADSLDLSKTYIYRVINRIGKRDSLIEFANKLYISKEIEKEIKDYIKVHKSLEPRKYKSVELIDSLKKEIELRDKIIEYQFKLLENYASINEDVMEIKEARKEIAKENKGFRLFHFK